MQLELVVDGDVEEWRAELRGCGRLPVWRRLLNARDFEDLTRPANSRFPAGGGVYKQTLGWPDDQQKKAPVGRREGGPGLKC